MGQLPHGSIFTYPYDQQIRCLLHTPAFLIFIKITEDLLRAWHSRYSAFHDPHW
jgi:hypothetical protein